MEQPEIHPARELIERFLLGEGTPEEKRFVTQHLVRGCSECRKLARAAWYRTGSEAGPLDLAPGP